MSLGDLYGFVVYDCGIDPNYFLDKMSSEEVGYLAKSHVKAYRDPWERLRHNMHAVYNSQGAKLKPEVILPFPWDNEDKEANRQTNEEIEKDKERLRKRYNIQ